jgi:hypothetical protein
MTRKDYILIAEVLRIEYLNAHGKWERDAINATSVSMADSLHRDNVRFNSEHFLAVIRGEKALMSRPNGGAR